MIPDAIYTHPRPYYAAIPRTNSTLMCATTPRPTLPVTREEAIQTALDTERRVARLPPSFSCIADQQGGFTVRCPEESYSTENVGEALRLKQRMKAQQALKSVRTNGDWASRGPPELVPPSPSTSSASSPGNSPPSTPQLPSSHIAFPPTQASERGREAIRSGTGQSHGNLLRRKPTTEESLARPRADRTKCMMPRPTTWGTRRPSQSRSSIIHRTLSRQSSRSSTASTSPARASGDTTPIVDFMRQLAPLPRFNPYGRARAESMTSVVDTSRQDLGGAFCGLFPRRRCKSEPSASAAKRR